MPRAKSRQQRVSASLIFAALQDRSAAIPTFSYDAGVVLRPELMQVLCGYGRDGSIDDSKPTRCEQPLIEHDPAGAARACVPGCGDPPDWCRREEPYDERTYGGGKPCGLMWGPTGEVRPWRLSEFGGIGGMLDWFAKLGTPYTEPRIEFQGYNEIVVASDAWIEHLPWSVEAIFLVECSAGERNLVYAGADGPGTAKTCEDAQNAARQMHAWYLRTYYVGVPDAARRFPLLKLRPHAWDRPFAAVDGFGRELVETLPAFVAP